MISKKIGFIGCGNMGRAILYGALKNETLSKEHIYVYDISPVAMEKAKELGVNLAENNEDLCKKSDLLILATKPQNAAEALKQCSTALDDKGLISIAAGLTSSRLASMAEGHPRILRIMPNAAAMVFQAASAFCIETDLTDTEKNSATEIFESVGIVEWVPEKLIDAVCGLSGGGPAYAAMFIEALADGGVKNGLPRATAYRLAAQSCLGAAQMILDTNIHPGTLKDMVTSPGGTTIEGIEALEKGGMRYAVIDCINAASDKSSRL